MSRLPRRGDDLGVVSVREHHAPPPRAWLALADGRVEVLGGRDLEALHSRRQSLLVLGLDQQVNVVALDAEMDDAEVFSPGGSERRFANGLIDAAAPQVTDRADDPQHDVNRVAFVEKRPLLVRRTGTLPLGWPARTAPLASSRLEQD